MTVYVRNGGVYDAVDFSAVYVKNGGVQHQAKEVVLNVGGVRKTVWLADGPPPAPTGITSVALNGGRVDVGWSWPANIENDYLRAEVQEPGDVGRLQTAYPATVQHRTGYPHNVAVPLQVRSVDQGGQVSDWVTAPTVTSISVAPPPAIVNSFAWDGSISQWRINWNDPANPQGDIQNVQVYLKNSSEGTYTLVGTYAYTGGANREITTIGRGWDTLHQMFIRVTNAAGFLDTVIFQQWTPPSPGTEKTIVADDANSYAFAAGAYRNDGTVRQGQFAPTPMGLHFGLFYYGNKLWDAGHGYQPVGGDIFMMRNGTEGFTGPLFFTGHAYGAKTGAAPTGSGTGWTSVSEFAGSDAAAWEPIPTATLASIAAGVTKGIGLFTFSTFQSNYKVFKGPAMNAFAGVVKLRW